MLCLSGDSPEIWKAHDTSARVSLEKGRRGIFKLRRKLYFGRLGPEIRWSIDGLTDQMARLVFLFLKLPIFRICFSQSVNIDVSVNRPVSYHFL